MAKRKSAPESVRVIDPFTDDRTVIISEHQALEPGFVFSWQREGVADRELQRAGQTIVKDGDTIVMHGDSVLVKTPLDLYKKQRDAQGRRSYEMTRRIVQGEPGSLKKFAKAVVPKRRAEEPVQEDDEE